MKRTVVLLAIIGLIVAGAAGWLVLRRSGSDAIPPDIKKQLTFKAYIPSGSYTIAKDKVSYDSKQAVLTYTIDNNGKPEVVMAEEPYPETLIYDKLIGTMNADRQVGNSLGEATVTHPKNAPGKEVTVVQADTTLMFISSDNKLSDAAWRDLLNSLNALH